LAQEGHRLRHSVLNGEKMRMVEKIAQTPRKSIQRQQLFTEMHAKLSTALLHDPRVIAWQRRVAEGDKRHLEEVALFDRELFYAIQPRQRLEMIIGEYRKRF
jgi:hypothetical protein